MVRKSLLVAALLATAAPLAAQERTVQWVSNRPDGEAPLGILDARLLPQHRISVAYRFFQDDYNGLWMNGDSLTLNQGFQLYRYVPHSLQNQTHELDVAYAVTSMLTIDAHMTYSHRQREEWSLSNDTVRYYQTKVKELGDLQVSALYSVYDQGLYRAHIQLGVLVPTGAYDPTGLTPFSGTEQSLPYDMRAGAGVFGVLPGITVQGQNDYGSIGMQARGTVYIGTNNKGFAPGNKYEFTAWAAYKLNEYFSVSARARFERWDAINGADPSLNAYIGQDPGYDGYSVKGHRLQIPVGLNVYLPKGMRLGGNRLSIEYIPTSSQYYQGPQLGANWGLVLGWQKMF